MASMASVVVTEAFVANETFIDKKGLGDVMVDYMMPYSYTVLELKYMTLLKLLDGFESLDWEIKFQELNDAAQRIIEGVYVEANNEIKKRDCEILMLKASAAIKRNRK